MAEDFTPADSLKNSILRTIKKMLGLDLDHEEFDTDVIVHINAAMMILQQLGVGPEKGMFITGIGETWGDFFDSDQMLEGVKLYIYYRTRMTFDPPNNSYTMDSLQKSCEMLEWRLKEQARFFDKDEGKYVSKHLETAGGSDS